MLTELVHNYVYAILATKYPSIFHSLDVWHKEKKLRKALTKVFTVCMCISHCILELA